MKLPPSLFARVVSLVLVLLATPLAAQVPDEEMKTSVPLDSLVLVLNLISSTHARPATGVVLAARTQDGNSLLLVPASFVGAGDEIIALDGGNDILKNGRPTRTVARSSEAGVAVLEVEGMARPGVTLSGDAWTEPVTGTYEFAAWPAAGALAEGAALIVRSFRPGESPAQVSGPVFGRCGHLVAMFIADDDGRLSGSPELAEFLDSFEIKYDQAACSGTPDAVQTVDRQESGSAAEPDSPAGVTGNAGSPGDSRAPPVETITSLGLTPAQKTGLMIAWVMLALLAFVLYLRRRKRRKPAHIVLERRTEHGQRFHHRLKLDPQRRSAQFVRQGITVDLKMTGLGLEFSMPEKEQGGRPGFVLDGTPCLAGEKFILEEGQEIQLGNETFLWVADSDKPGAQHGKQ